MIPLPNKRRRVQVYVSYDICSLKEIDRHNGSCFAVQRLRAWKVTSAGMQACVFTLHTTTARTIVPAVFFSTGTVVHVARSREWVLDRSESCTYNISQESQNAKTQNSSSGIGIRHRIYFGSRCCFDYSRFFRSFFSTMARWFRSEPMDYVSLIVNEDAAHDCLSELGVLGVIQFTDVSRWVPGP